MARETPTQRAAAPKRAAKSVSKTAKSQNGNEKAGKTALRKTGNKADVVTRKQATGKTVEAVLACLRLGLSYTETAARTGYNRTTLYDLRRKHVDAFAAAEEEGARADLHDADATRREIMLDIAADPHARLKAVDLTQKRRQAATLDVRVTVGENTDWDAITPEAMQAAIARQVGKGGQGG